MTTPIQIAVVEDDDSLRDLLHEELESAGYQVSSFADAEALLAVINDNAYALVLSDIRLPGMSGLQLLNQLKQRPSAPAFILITAFGTVDQAVAALRQGADDFITKPLDLDHLLVSVARVLEFYDLQQQVAYYQRVSQQHQGPAGIIGNSRVMQQLYADIQQIAGADGAVLILGESGTGKELVARALHQCSSRKEQPFLAVNCAGIPAELMESEFFGHAAGAFTGAQKARTGLLREADGGSLLLDEIGEMPLALQAKLLRVLQEGRMRPVGSDHEVTINVRIMAATHQPLEQRMIEGSFREDLYYRLETFALEVPPLRQRGDDVLLLSELFLEQLKQQQAKPIRGFSAATQRCLQNYRFPGNVRELQNAIERAYTFCRGALIEPEHLPSRIHSNSDSSHATNQPQWPTLQQLQDDYVQKVMVHCQGNKQRAAQLLGVTRRTLYRWLTSVE